MAYYITYLGKNIADDKGPYATESEARREIQARASKFFANIGDYSVIKQADPPSATSHYTTLSPEPITVIEGWGFNANFYRANAVKYIARAGRKDTSVGGTVRDLQKAISYLQREINALNGNPAW